MTNKEAQLRCDTQDILNKFVVNKYDWNGHLVQDVDLTFSQAILAVEMIVDLPVRWADIWLLKEYPEAYRSEETLEYWQEILNELKSMR